MYGPRLLNSVARPMLACGFVLQLPETKLAHVSHESEGKIGTAERAASAQYVKAKLWLQSQRATGEIWLHCG